MKNTTQGKASPKLPTEAEKQHACDMQVIRDSERYTFAAAQAGHSTLPWNEKGGIITAGISPGQPYIADCRFGPVANREANAKLIVASVNNAGKLEKEIAHAFDMVNRVEPTHEAKNLDQLVSHLICNRGNLQDHAGKLAEALGKALHHARNTNAKGLVREFEAALAAWEAAQ